MPTPPGNGIKCCLRWPDLGDRYRCQGGCVTIRHESLQWGVEAVKFLALNLESVTNAAIPAEHGMKDIVEVGQFQAVRHSHQPDHHWVNVPEYCTQNQPFEGCCCTHPLSLRLIPDFVLHSNYEQIMPRTY